MRRCLLLFALVSTSFCAQPATAKTGRSAPLLELCRKPQVRDGDTFTCAGRARRIRIAGIDAPELTSKCSGRAGRQCVVPVDEAHNGIAAKIKLQKYFQGHRVYIRVVGDDPYKRDVAQVCTVAGNISALMIKGGFALFKPTWHGARVNASCAKTR